MYIRFVIQYFKKVKNVFFIQVLLNVPAGLAEHQFWRAPYIGSGQQQKGLCPWQVGEIADFQNLKNVPDRQPYVRFKIRKSTK